MSTAIQNVQSIYQAFGAGNVPAILEALDRDVQWDVWREHSAQRAGTPHLQPRRGPDEVMAFFQVLSGLTFHEFKVLGGSGDERQVAAEIDIDFSVGATGRRVRDEELHLWTFGADGKVTRFRHYVDTAKHAWVHGLVAKA